MIGGEEQAAGQAKRFCFESSADRERMMKVLIWKLYVRVRQMLVIHICHLGQQPV